MQEAVSFFSEGYRLQGDVYVPDGLAPGESRAGIVLCHGYTGVKDLYLPDLARALNRAGYVVLTFDYKGWGGSEGARQRLAPHSRVADAAAAMTFLGLRPEAEAARIGVMGMSHGGSIAVWLAATDERMKCVVSVVAPGHGGRWMERVRAPAEWAELKKRSDADRAARVRTGVSQFVPRADVLYMDPESARLSGQARQTTSTAADALPLEYIDETVAFNPRVGGRPYLAQADPVHHLRRRRGGSTARIGGAARVCGRTEEAGRA